MLVFGAGIMVGYRGGIFSSRFGENYYHNFYGPTPVVVGKMPMSPHGTVGTVLDISSSSISVKDPNGDEQSVAVDSSTVIRELNNTITLSDIKINDQVTVLGEPNEQGQIYARFIRVFNGTSSIPQGQ